MKEFIISKPDDWHLHLREGTVLKNIISFTSEFFGRAIVMPNTKKPITSIEKCISYKKSISEALSSNSTFKPLMTIYLTDETIKDELIEGFKNKVFFAAKLYPANATTNSSHGVKKIENLYKIFIGNSLINRCYWSFSIWHYDRSSKMFRCKMNNIF